MKESPQNKNLEQILRSSKLVAGGFMGCDSRRVTEIIEADAFELSRFGCTREQLAARMQEITDISKGALGNWIEVDKKHLAKVDEARGLVPCPWPHSIRFTKRITTVKNHASGEMLRWTDLNIHFIAEHGFFEGRGSTFRLEPGRLVKIIF